MNKKRFAFVNDAAEREYKNFQKSIQIEFGTSLRAIQENKKPFLNIRSLSSIGAGVIELKINGHPAFRCVYIAKYFNTVIVLHSFEKTTNGVDKQAMATVKARYKELKSQLKN
ncbi:type II toxin-antitoxin system RelE/ParE family toxin [Methyloprofundus sedimenti]|uniref:type II toxin-antitoxin system RelE/ParE family toxin n=1 Tax=Methyloprofundus sedimenti TaxID=1420851 RepID=UPI0018E92DA9|nr:type II toxin-antitoxin system RelE/ParE family toxin [Methyloprofundus sedimenti]